MISASIALYSLGERAFKKRGSGLPLCFRTAASLHLSLQKNDATRQTQLVFPIGTHSGGPPFAVSQEAYESVLIPAGLELIETAPVPPEESFGPRAGREALSLWRWPRSQAAL